MVKLPTDFVANKYPGYFWNLYDQKLYSIKVSGILRPLYLHEGNYFNGGFPHYRISVDGQPKCLYVDNLKKLKPANSVIPVAQKDAK